MKAVVINKITPYDKIAVSEVAVRVPETEIK